MISSRVRESLVGISMVRIGPDGESARNSQKKGGTGGGKTTGTDRVLQREAATAALMTEGAQGMIPRGDQGLTDVLEQARVFQQKMRQTRIEGARCYGEAAPVTRPC